MGMFITLLGAIIASFALLRQEIRDQTIRIYKQSERMDQVVLAIGDLRSDMGKLRGDIGIIQNHLGLPRTA
jgi:hypothetical protein